MSSKKTQLSKRLQIEMVNLIRDQDQLPNITAGPTDDSDLYKWTGTIAGPKDSPYEGGLFVLDIDIPEEYPFAPPRFKFRTQVFHCNVGTDGFICLDLLTLEKWAPAMTISSALLSISSLLCDPNPNHITTDAMIGTATESFMKDREEYDRIAKKWTELYAMPPKE